MQQIYKRTPMPKCEQSPGPESLFNPNLEGWRGGGRNLLIRANFCVPNFAQSPDIRQNSDDGIYDFRNSGQSLIKVNCYNSRTSDDIDIKLGPVTKFDKRNKTTSKKFNDEAMSKVMTSL